MAAPKYNTNAEKWNIDTATEFMQEAHELSRKKVGGVYKYDFIGELARDMQQYKEIFSYLSTKFPSLKWLHNKIRGNCESNCFHNGKNQNIVPSMAIMNLKSNHGWTDRVDNTTQGESINKPLSAEEVQKAKDSLNDDV